MLKQVPSIKEESEKTGDIRASLGLDNAPIEVTNET